MCVYCCTNVLPALLSELDIGLKTGFRQRWTWYMVSRSYLITWNICQWLNILHFLKLQRCSTFYAIFLCLGGESVAAWSVKIKTHFTLPRVSTIYLTSEHSCQPFNFAPQCLPFYRLCKWGGGISVRRDKSPRRSRKQTISRRGKGGWRVGGSWLMTKMSTRCCGASSKFDPDGFMC